MFVEAERQRLSSIAANERERTICREQSECAAEADGLVAAAANRATDEKDRRAVDSAVQKVALAASRLTDPTGTC
jgi:hypothetical protein